jgi:hypothetical protein
VLFFPSNNSANLSAASRVVEPASYVAQPASASPVANASVTPATSAGSAATSAVVNAAVSAPPQELRKLSDAVAAASASSSTRPRTASLALAVPGGAQAVSSSGLDNALLGRTYSGSIRIYGYDVQLPTGNWALLANISGKQPSLAGEELYLGRISKRRLEGSIRITAVHSTSMPGKGFRQVKGCVEGQAESSYVMAEQIVPFGHQSCWLIQNYFTTPFQKWADRATHLDPLIRAAAGDLAAKGVSYPQDMMMVKFTRAETWGLLEVEYMFSPEAEGITSADVVSYTDSDWHVGISIAFPRNWPMSKN